MEACVTESMEGWDALLFPGFYFVSYKWKQEQS